MLKYIKRTVSTGTTHIDSEKDIVAPLLNDIFCRVTANSCKPGAKTIGPTGRAYNADWEKSNGGFCMRMAECFARFVWLLRKTTDLPKMVQVRSKIILFYL
jgi:hypothetical protein